MARGDKFTPRRTGDRDLDQFQDDVRDVFDQLEGPRRGNLEAKTIKSSSADYQVGEGLAFWYVGDGVGAWRLPPAKLRGQGRSLVLTVTNASAYALTVKAAGPDTIDGGASILIGPGTAATVSSDGDTRWSRGA